MRASDKVREGDYPQLKTVYVETRKGILKERQKCLFSEAAALPPVRKMHSQGEILAKVRSLAGGHVLGQEPTTEPSRKARPPASGHPFCITRPDQQHRTPYILSVIQNFSISRPKGEKLRLSG